jgi:glycosyltransferase involved in cell wall biosynthesis
MPGFMRPRAVAPASADYPMKILFFIRSLDVGGSQRQLAMLAAGLARRSHAVTVALLYLGHPAEATLERAGVRVVRLNKRGRWDVTGPVVRLWRLFLAERADAIYSFLPTQTTLAALLLPPWSPTRLVFGVRSAAMELDKYDALSALSYRLETLLSRRADLVITNAHAARADAIARGLPADRIAVIANGIDTETMRPDPAAGRALRATWRIAEDEFVIGMVARLDPMKDHANFIAAAAAFLQRQPDARFVCIGDGPPAYRQQLEALAQSRGLGGRILWVAEASELRAVYNAFDIATLASAFGEGFPNAVGEAMACGVPVVATDVGDVGAVVGDCGEVVPPRQPDRLSEAWMRMRSRLEWDASLRADVRTRIVRHYDVNTMVEKSERVLSALCAGRSVEEFCQ